MSTPTHKQAKQTEAEQQFLVAAHDSRYKALYHLAIKTGIRQGELFGLKWVDLQFNNGTLHIQRQVQRVPGKSWGFVEPKTKAGRRTIQLGEGSLQVLRVQKEHLTQQIMFAGERWKGHGLIFPTKVGTPDDLSNLRKDFIKTLMRAGLPLLRFHDLRHTAASLMLNNGVPSIVVSRILGHAKPSITMDIYGHLYHEMQSEAARIMDELVTPVLVDMTELKTQGVIVGKNDTSGRE